MSLILTSLFGDVNVTDSCSNFGLSKFFLALLLIETGPWSECHRQTPTNETPMNETPMNEMPLIVFGV